MIESSTAVLLAVLASCCVPPTTQNLISNSLQIVPVRLQLTCTNRRTAKTILCTLNRNAPPSFTVPQLPARLCTHISYGFVEPQAASGRLAPLTGDALGTIAQLVDLKRAANPTLRILLAVGSGSTDFGAVFSHIVGDAGRRGQLIDSLRAVCAALRLDGIDVVWNYPTAADRENFVAFLRELRGAFERSSSRLTIAVAVGADTRLIGSAYDVAALSRVVDLINLVTYDRRSPLPGGRTALNAPLFGGSDDDGDASKINADRTVRAWLRAGAAPAKLLFGIPFAGRDFRLCAANAAGLGAAARATGFVSYRQVCERFARGGWRTAFVERQQSAFAWTAAGQWMSYENVRAVRAKTAYAVRAGLGGVQVWSVEFDDVNGACGAGGMPLLRAVNEELCRPVCEG